MFYFIFRILFYVLIILISFHILNKKRITILETLILLFIFHICIISYYQKISIFITIILSSFLLTLYFFYKYIYENYLNQKLSRDKVIINRGIINFHELLNENYTYDSLLYELKKRGINNPSLVDYCIKRGNELIIFRKNSIKNFPISLIIDGKILKDNLFSIQRSEEWLNEKIDNASLKLSDINYAYFKNKNVYFITD